jgi:hypothetical protein
MISDPTDPNSKHLLGLLVCDLERMKDRAQGQSLPAPDGVMTLGLSRFVSDWIDELGCPLSLACGAIDRHFMTGGSSSSSPRAAAK